MPVHKTDRPQRPARPNEERRIEPEPEKPPVRRDEADPDKRPVPKDVEPKLVHARDDANVAMLRQGAAYSERAQAVFRPVDGTDWDDPEFEHARDDYAKSMAKLAREEPVESPLMVDNPADHKRREAPPVTTVRPETIDQQTPHIVDVQPVPGSRLKVETVSTDPSVVQVQRPVGQIAQDNADDFEALAATMPGVASMLKRLADLEEQVKAKDQSGSAVYVRQTERPAWIPEKYLKHYRHDTQPMLRVYMAVYDEERDKYVDDKSTQGEYIQFHNGHFFAETPEQVAILDWKMNHPSHHPTTGQVIGGDPGIYVDDESPDVIYCPDCLATGEKTPFASATKLAAHRRATHRIGVEV